jgi:hypothetical protein
MQRVGNILKKFINDFGLETGLTLTTIKNQWIELVGQTIATHTSPDIIKGKTIFIIVDTPQWMHHLSFYKQDICEKLKPYKVTEIRFKLGKLRVEDSFRKRAGIKQEINNISLTEEDSRYIENTVRGIKDNELKEKFRALISHALRNEKRL